MKESTLHTQTALKPGENRVLINGSENRLSREEINALSRCRFAAYIRELKAVGISMYQIELRTGIRRSALSNYLRGDRKHLTMDALTAIQQATGMEFRLFSLGEKK